MFRVGNSYYRIIVVMDSGLDFTVLSEFPGFDLDLQTQDILLHRAAVGVIRERQTSCSGALASGRYRTMIWRKFYWAPGSSWMVNCRQIHRVYPGFTGIDFCMCARCMHWKANRQKQESCFCYNIVYIWSYWLEHFAITCYIHAICRAEWGIRNATLQ